MSNYQLIERVTTDVARAVEKAIRRGEVPNVLDADTATSTIAFGEYTWPFGIYSRDPLVKEYALLLAEGEPEKLGSFIQRHHLNEPKNPKQDIFS